MARAWLKSGVLRKDGNAELRRVFEKDLFTCVGGRPVRLASEQDLRDALVAVVAHGANRVAVQRWRDLPQMFAGAEKRQPWRKPLIDGNPAELVRIETIVQVDSDMSNVRERTLSAREILELRDILRRMEVDHACADDSIDLRTARH